MVSTDAGHTGTSASFGADPQARTDHAYNSYDKTAVASKSLISTRYGRKPDYSYFSGCSGGGRQGMMFSQRFPDYFDGITAGAMGTSIATTLWESRAAMHHAHLTELLVQGQGAFATTVQQLQAAGMSAEQAYAQINRLIDQQAYTLAVDDMFRLSAWLFIALIALVWLIKPSKNTAGGDAAAGAH